MAGFDNYGSNVRVRHESNWMNTSASDIFVDELTSGEWSEVLRFNSLADDYAYSKARSAAAALQSKLLGVVN